MAEIGMIVTKVDEKRLVAYEKNALLDLLRGFAVFFLPLSNALSFLMPYHAKIAPNFYFGLSQTMRFIWGIYHVLIELKLLFLLCIVFGVSFGLSVIHHKNQAGSAFSDPIYDSVPDSTAKIKLYRRALGLFLLGAIHGLFFWPGDILLMYGIALFLLVKIVTIVDTPIKVLSCAIVLLMILYGFNLYSTSVPYIWGAEEISLANSLDHQFIDYSFFSLSLYELDNRIQQACFFLVVSFFSLFSYLWSVLALFLFGIFLVKLGYFSCTNPTKLAHTPNQQILKYRKNLGYFRYSLFLTIPALVGISYWQQYINWSMAYGSIFFWYCFEILSLLVVTGTIVWVVQYEEKLTQLLPKFRGLRFFQSAGKLALSLYLFQTVCLSILVFLFSRLPIENRMSWLIEYNQVLYLIFGGVTLCLSIGFVKRLSGKKRGPAEQVLAWIMHPKNQRSGS